MYGSLTSYFFLLPLISPTLCGNSYCLVDPNVLSWNLLPILNKKINQDIDFVLRPTTENSQSYKSHYNHVMSKVSLRHHVTWQELGVQKLNRGLLFITFITILIYFPVKCSFVCLGICNFTVFSGVCLTFRDLTTGVVPFWFSSYVRPRLFGKSHYFPAIIQCFGSSETNDDDGTSLIQFSKIYPNGTERCRFYVPMSVYCTEIITSTTLWLCLIFTDTTIC